MNNKSELERLDEELAFKITVDGKEVLASIYNIIDGEIKLEEIMTDAEWDMVDEMLAKVSEINE